MLVFAEVGRTNRRRTRRRCSLDRGMDLRRSHPPVGSRSRKAIPQTRSETLHQYK